MIANKPNTYLLYILFFILICTAGAGAQTKKQLASQRKQIQQEIDYINKLLEQTNKKSQASLNRLVIIQRKISERNKVLRTIEKELELIEEHIGQVETSIEIKEKGLDAIKGEYAQILFHAYKNRSSYNKLMFILSAESFNQSYKRLKYYQQYTDYRKKQADEIVVKQNELKEKLVQLTESKKLKEQLRNQKKNESVTLLNEKKELTTTLGTLKKEEKDLLRKMEEQQRVAKELEVSVTGTVTANVTTKVEDVANTTNFSKAKGKLPWPVKKGVITRNFGKQAHSVLAGIVVNNHGIELSTTEGADALAVFAGKVANVINIPGDNTAVLLNHGTYYTIYSNLTDIYVKLGDQVEAQQKLGKIFSDKSDNNATTLKFQVWHNRKKLNPARWLKKR